MTTSTSRSALRRAAACLAAGGLVLLAPLGVRAALPGQATPSPSAGASSSSSSSSTCTAGLDGTLCLDGVGASPTPSPTATPTARPTARPTATAQPSHPGAAAAAAATTPSPSASATATPPPLPASAIAGLSSAFSSAPLLSSLLDILRHPLSSDRPALHHFRPSPGLAGTGLTRDGTSATDDGLLWFGPGGGNAPWRTAVAVLLGLALAATAVARWTTIGRSLASEIAHRARTLRPPVHPHLPRLRPFTLATARHRRLAGLGTAVLACSLTAAVLTGGGRTGTLGISAGRHVAAVPAAAVDAGRRLRAVEAAADPATPPPAAKAPAWVQLVSIEQGLAAQEDELAAQEAEITRLARIVSLHPAPGDDAGGPTDDGGAATAAARNALPTLVAAHDAVNAAHEQSLAAEYDAYRQAAQDPVRRSQLENAAAAVAPSAPAVRDAVQYNLAVTATQVQQEQAIAAAEQQLAALGYGNVGQLGGEGKFIVPVDGAVSQLFGPTDFSLEPPLTYGGTFYPHFHTGVDIGAPMDTPVHAAADGVVILATQSTDGHGTLTGYGNYVVIAHPGGFVTLYGHNDRLLVTQGDVVKKGQTIALLGSTGFSTGPHCHFEIRHSRGGFGAQVDELVDPALFVANQLPGLVLSSVAPKQG